MELDEEPDLAVGDHAMQDLGHDDAGQLAVEDVVARERPFDDVAQPAVEHMDHAPDSRLRRMIVSQRVRYRALIEFARSLVRRIAGRQLEAIAEDARELDPDPLGAAFGGHYPRTNPERRTVANVLAVPAPELGDPVADLVLMKSLDRALHGCCDLDYNDSRVLFASLSRTTG